MIRQFFCLLLVLLMLANQGLCFAHAHHAADVAEPEGHASRPHFHVAGHGHHESSHDHHADQSHGQCPGPDHRPDDHDAARPAAIAPVDDHDADAVYRADAVTFARDGSSAIVLSAKCVAVAAIVHGADQSDDKLLRLGPLRGQSPSVFDAACPIYLRTLSLRI